MIDPLPNLLFTRDSSAWIGDQVAVTSLAMPARRRETSLTEVIYRAPPALRRHRRWPTSRSLEPVEGGDVLLLAPGRRSRSAPASGPRRPGSSGWPTGRCRRGLAHTVLAVPIAQERATMHLDTVCTMVDVDAVVMYPAMADTLEALTVTRDDAALQIGPRRAVPGRGAPTRWGSTELRVIDTGLDPVTAEREQWDDGNNTLCIAPRLAVAYERNTQTNARLEAAGIEVVAISGSELGSGRGGPRCMSCPIVRDPL